MRLPQIRLFPKIFGSFLLTSIATVGLMVFILEFYAAKNFALYRNRIELETYRAVSEELKKIYNQRQSWEFLHNNGREWRAIIERTILSDLGKLFDEKAEFQGRGEPDPWTRRRDAFRRHGRKGRIGAIGKRLALFDRDKTPIAPRSRGVDFDHFFTKPILLENRLIGWLGVEKMRSFQDPTDISFLRGQTEAIYITGIGILLFAALVAYLLTRHLTRPIKLIMRGTKDVSLRKFDTRIELKSSDELGQLADDFNRMARTLEKYEELRKQWFSDISHELGTPLTILRGEIESVQDGIRPLNLESLAYEIHHIDKIVNDMRELSLAETGGLTLRTELIDPQKFVLEVVQIYRPRFNRAGIELTVSESGGVPAAIQGDAIKLKQLFSNILENSLRYTDKPGELKIVFQSDASHIAILFRDSGPGVPEESIPLLFDRLYRVETSRNRVKGGSGLGLAICKHIAELHNGYITAENKNGGLQLTIGLPTG